MANYRRERKGGASHSQFSRLEHISTPIRRISYVHIQRQHNIHLCVCLPLGRCSLSTVHTTAVWRLLWCQTTRSFRTNARMCLCESVALVAYFYCYSNCIITHMTFSNSAIQKFWQISYILLRISMREKSSNSSTLIKTQNEYGIRFAITTLCSVHTVCSLSTIYLFP